jgi:hypothetical protein
MSSIINALLSTNAPGQPGQFDFLTGEWHIDNRRLNADGSWDEFPGEASCYSILQGVVSIEELRIPARQFSGMGLRVLDVTNATWSDFWVNAKSGVLRAPGMVGGFCGSIGTFISEETDEAQAILVRGVWQQISPDACSWQQSVSRDQGQTWQADWAMQWRRK